MFFFIMFPAVIGIAVVSKPLYIVFYGYSAFGTSILQWSSYMSLFLGLFVLLGSTLQAANQTKSALTALFIGLMVKLGTQFPLLYLFQTHGMLFSNILGFGVTIYIMLLTLNKLAPLAIKPLAKQIGLIVLVTFAMSIVVFITQISIYRLFDPENRVGAVINVGISAAIGGLFYLYVTLKIRLADRLLVNRIEGLRHRLKIK
ncbi:MAG: polysaccharide biosynthesis C-terminal domain-containing protein [Carnobacterium sp.]|uniref:polysaccharide biosynthesis C-terminal domain-containing protein n=1 Tax=Carnobacterium sp. TaxID=48221 RepID=UPI003C7256E7